MAGYFFKRHFFTGRLKAFEISDTCRHLPPQVLIALIGRNLGRSVGGGAWRFFCYPGDIWTTLDDALDDHFSGVSLISYTAPRRNAR